MERVDALCSTTREKAQFICNKFNSENWKAQNNVGATPNLITSSYMSIEFYRQ